MIRANYESWHGVPLQNSFDAGMHYLECRRINVGPVHRGMSLSLHGNNGIFIGESLRYRFGKHVVDRSESVFVKPGF